MGWALRVSMNSLGGDAIVANASGCGTMLKDYGFLLRTDPAYAAKAAQIAGLARDVSEVITELGLRNSGNIPELRVAYHSACSLQHGQRVDREPKALLAAAGFAKVKTVAARKFENLFRDFTASFFTSFAIFARSGW